MKTVTLKILDVDEFGLVKYYGKTYTIVDEFSSGGKKLFVGGKPNTKSVGLSNDYFTFTENDISTWNH